MCRFPSERIGDGLPVVLLRVPKHVSIAVSVIQQMPGKGASLPAGSLRWERLVRSSLASSIVGFIKGGSAEALPFWRSSSETSNVLVCVQHQDPVSYVDME